MAGHRFETYWWLHMSDAAMNARRVYELERSNPQYPPQDTDALAWHRSCSISGIILAACALESFANDLFLSPFHQSDDLPFSNGARTIIKVAWFRKIAPYRTRIERLSALEKIAAALQLAGGSPLPESDPLYKSSALAVRLRDAFVHSKTRTRPALDGPLDLSHDSHEALENDLQGCPFATTNYYARNATPAPPGARFIAPPIFPYGCYDHACVDWVITSHLAVMRHIENALNLGAFGPRRPHARFDTVP